MKNKPFLLLFALLLGMSVLSCTEKKEARLGVVSVDRIVSLLTLEEKVQLLVGAGASGTTTPIPRLGIPAITFADGSAGLQISPAGSEEEQAYNCTAFPIATLLASTWNTELIESVGKAMGNEVLESGVDVLLAPALNIHRNPLCGRNFEYYSEDPVVSGKIAAAMVKGVQSNGVGASLKYFAVNNQQTNCTKNDSRLTPRALREIYLKGFELAVKESNPWTVMSSCNYINGRHASESKGLLQTILRDEWGFKGTVLTDKCGGKDASAQVQAGNDLLMPGCPRQYEDIIAAVNSGKLKVTDINRNVKNILNLIVKTPRFNGYTYTNEPDLKAHAEVARLSATEGMVLLQNRNGILPLPASAKKVIYSNENLPDARLLKKQAELADVALITIERTSDELVDRKLRGDFELTANEHKMIQAVCRAYQSAGKKTIVVLNIGGMVETASWKNYPDAILLAWQGGQEAANALADVLCGKANPSGKLTMTFPINYMDVASSANFPWGANDEKDTDVDYTIYEEDIYVGYRYFDTFRKEVSYPFGHGLSYTTFAYENAELKKEKDEFIVSVDVVNTGKMAGKEVVQLYVSAPIGSSLPKPLKELKAFAKTRELTPGERQRVTFTLTEMELASFSDSRSAWVADRGVYKFLLGSSSQDIRIMLEGSISESIVKEVKNVLLPHKPINTIEP